MSSETAAPNTNWLETIISPKNATVDIVAVHGMNTNNNQNHSDGAWTDEKSGINWLKTLLPPRIPNARILAFKYNANIVFQTSSAGIKEQAQNMLQFLSADRQSDRTRPIIFIAHSMGGIVVKEALATAFHGDKAHAMISSMTYGFIFFGVPHQGSEHAQLAKLVAYNQSFADSIAFMSAYNDDLNSRWMPLCKNYRFASICETLSEETKRLNLGMVVRSESATLGLPRAQEIVLFLNRSHTTICKFASSTEPEWKQVSDIICDFAKSAVGNFGPSLTVPNQGLEEEDDFDVSQAVNTANDALASIEKDLKGGNAFRTIQDEINSLSAGVIPIVTWLCFIIQPILIPTAWVLIPAAWILISSVLPSRNTITNSIVQVQKSEERIADLHLKKIEKLDKQRISCCQAISMLRIAQGSTSIVNENNMDGSQLKLCRELQLKLSEQVEQIVYERHISNQKLRGAESAVAIIEQGKKETEGKDDKEFFIYLGKKVEEEATRQKLETLLKKDDNKGWWCCIL